MAKQKRSEVNLDALFESDEELKGKKKELLVAAQEAVGIVVDDDVQDEDSEWVDLWGEKRGGDEEIIGDEDDEAEMDENF